MNRFLLKMALAFCIVHLSFSPLLAQCMNGIYTVGGVSPNFVSVSQAVSAMNTLGICGPVEFRLRNGIYPGGITIRNITGVSAINTIRITSETGDSTQVVFNCNLSTSSSAGILIDTCSYIKIDHVTFSVQAGSLYGASAISMRGTSKFICVESCVFQQPAGGSGAYIENPYSYADITGLKIAKCLFNTGYVAINLFGVSSTNTYSSNFQVIENSFQNFTNSAFKIFAGNDILIEKNNFNSLVSVPAAYQLSVAAGGVVEIINNRCVSNAGGFDLSLDIVSPSPPADISNNMISAGVPSGSTTSALHVVGLNNIRIYHNTLRSTSPASSNSLGKATLVFNGTNYSNVELRNNIIYNAGGGLCFNSGFLLFTSTNNAWFTTGSDFAQFNLVFYNNLQTYQTANSIEQNSLFTNPFFVSPTDLHVNSYLLNSVGWSGTGILNDIDGQLRNNPPDIGADEFTPPANSVQNIAILSPEFPTCLGQTNVVIRIKNVGSSSLQSCQIRWYLNNTVQPIYNWSGNLQSGDSVNVTIGAVNLQPQTAYLISASTSSPNGQPDLLTNDDSLVVNTGNTYMSGTFIIGSFPSDFPTISMAVNALNTNGVCGPVLMLIKNGSYTENFTFQSIPGASATNTITFQSQSNDSSAVIINQQTNQFQIATFNNAKYIYLRALSFRVNHASYPRAILISNNADNIHIDRCAFRNINGLSLSANAQLISTSSSASGTRNNITIDSCLFSGGYAGFELNFVSGSSQNISVKESAFWNQYRHSIYLRFAEDVVVEGNRIDISPSTYSTPYGMNLESITGNLHVSFNEVYAQCVPGTALMVVGFGSTLPDSCIIYNNFFSGGKSAVFLSWSNNSMLFCYNNLRSANSTEAALTISSPHTVSLSGWRVVNNIIANYGTGSAFRQYNNAVFQQCNNNNFFSSGSTLIFGYGSLLSWRAQTGNDINSQSGNPNYFSASNLHVNLSSFPSNRAIPIPGINIDIDGQLRNINFPDIGADEYVGFSLDAQMQSLSPVNSICDSLVPVLVSFNNAGSTTLTDVLINWSINNQLQSPLLWNGTLASGFTSPMLQLGVVNQQLFTSYSIKAWIAQVNFGADMFALNDTLVQSALSVRMNGIYTIGGSNPDFSTIDQAYSALETLGVCGPVILNLRNGVYKENISIDSIPGAGVINTITLQSESGDSSLVIIENDTASYFVEPAIIVNSSSNLVFKAITFRLDLYPTITNSPTSSATRPGDLLVITEKSENIEVVSCRFIDLQYRSNFSYPLHQSPVAVLTNWHTPINLRFKNNYFEYGAVGLYLAGDSILVQGNRFSDQYLHGVYIVSNCRVIEVSKNEFSGRRSTPLYYAVAGAGSIDFKLCVIKKNVFRFVKAAGFVNINSNFQTQGRCFIANNYFELDTLTSGTLGAIAVQIDSIFFSYNTMRIHSGNPRAALTCTNIFPSGFMSVRNNCIVNRSGGVVADLQTGVQKILNTNLYFTTGAVFGRFNGNLCITFPVWVTNTGGQDLFSYNTNPLFQTQVPYFPADTLLNDRATFLPFEQEDLFGNLRSNTNPDIGAVEYVPYLLDAGLQSINSINMTCDGTHPIEVKIVNSGINTLTSVQLQYSINQSAPQTYNWTGSLGSGQSTGFTTIGSFNSLNGTSRVRVWVSLINSQSDPYPNNDTLENDSDVGPMSGVYTVGGSGTDFSLISDAVNALSNRGVCGPVQIKILPGIYYENLTIPSMLSGVSQADTVLFCSFSGNSDVEIVRNIQSGNSNHSVYIASDYVSLKQINIDAALHDNITLPSSYYSAVSIAGNHTQIDKCLIRATRYTQAVIPVRTGVNMIGDNITITNSQLLNFHSGVVINPILSQPVVVSELNFTNNIVNGSTEINYISEALIRENTFSSVFSGQYYSSASVIDGNIFSSCYLLLDGIQGDSVLVLNNFFINGTNLTGDYVLLANNTFNIHTPPPNFFAACNNVLTSSRLVNNIFHSETGFAMRYDNNSGGNQSNYNVYWNRSIPGDGLTYLNTLQTTSPGFDINSAAIDPMLVSAADLHIQNPLLFGVGQSVQYVIYDIDSNIRNTPPCIGADEYSAPVQMIWPGNTNNDTLVDNFDLLPIGVYNATPGYARWITSTNWQGFPGLNWGILQSNAEDIKHVDCNGDGTISSIDTTAVSLNYGLLDLQPLMPSNSLLNNRTAAPIFLVYPQATVMAGSTVTVEIWAGSQALPFTDVYGIGLRLSVANSGIIVSGSESIVFTNSWLCQPQISGWSMTRTFPGIQVEGSVVRFDHTGRSGFGKVAEVSFRTDSSLMQPDTLSLLFSRIEIIDSAGTPIPYGTIQSSLTVVPMITSIAEPELMVSTYPNPADEAVSFLLNSRNEHIRIQAYDLNGKLIVSENSTAVNGLFTVYVGEWAEGVYVFRFSTDSGNEYIVRVIVSHHL
jgi:pectin methylesterase-like acyl-CoA thioesterase